MIQVRRCFTLSAMGLLLALLCGCSGHGGKILYAVAPGSATVSIFTVSSSGALSVTTEPVPTGSGPVAMAIDPLLRFAYVVDAAGGNVPGGVSQYVLNAGTGSLVVATLPSVSGPSSPTVPIPTGVNPTAIAIDSTGSVLFVANHGSAGTCDNPATATPPLLNCTLSVFTIDATGGALSEVKQLQPPCTPTQNAPCPLPTFPLAPNALATTGKMLFVAMTNAGVGSISTYTFNTAVQNSSPPVCPAGPGCLQTPATSTITVGTNPTAMAMDSQGKFVFVTDPVANTVTALSIGSSGQLTAVGSPAPTGTKPVSVWVHPGGKFLFTANQGSNDVSGFSIDGSGALAPLSGFPVAVGTSPSAVTTDKAGSFLFVANRDANTISVFSIDNSGALKQVTGSPFASVVVNPVALISLN
jgi:DNA-binding beta-propeller fold protein YncE